MHLETIARYHLISAGSPQVQIEYPRMITKLNLCWNIMKGYRDSVIEKEKMQNDERRDQESIK